MSAPSPAETVKPIVPQNTGRYTHAFLDSVFGPGTYHLRTFKLNDLADRTILQQATECLEDQSLSLAYMSDEKLTCLWLHNHPGWMKFCEAKGIEITASPKISKRLTMMTRTAYLHHIAPVGEIKIQVVRPDEFSDYQGMLDDSTKGRILDGANVISRELLEKMITRGSKIIDEGADDPWRKGFHNRAIDGMGDGSIRVSTPDGQIKGDVLFSTRERMGGMDILTVQDNIKSEFKTHDFVFALVEPYPHWRPHLFSPDVPAPKGVWSDDQSMSWLGDWLYPPNELKEALYDIGKRINDDINAHRYPNFFLKVDNLTDELTTVGSFQGQALMWEQSGPGRNQTPTHAREGTSLPQSIFLQERIGQGVTNQLAMQRRWPVRCAAQLHVATDSWLHMAGFADADEHPWPFPEPQTPRGKVWVHEPTNRLVYNDLDFIEVYDRHGGWDSDDQVKAFFRTWKGRRRVIVLRSPNSWGEYDIKDYTPNSWFPTWKTHTGKTISFPKVADDRPEFLDEMDVTYEYDSLDPVTIGVASAGTGGASGRPYTQAMVKKAMEVARDFQGVFGSRINADIVYFRTMKDYRRSQMASVESMVDASTQTQSARAKELITKDTQQVINEMANSDAVADRVLWQQRIGKFDPRMSYAYLDWSDLVITHNEMTNTFRRDYFASAQNAVNNIDPDILTLGKRLVSKGYEMVNWYYRLMRNLPRPEGMTQRAFCIEVNDRMTAALLPLNPAHRADILLGMARACYMRKRGNQFKDTVLFQMGTYLNSPSVFRFYLDAIQFYQIGDVNPLFSHTCSACGNQVHITDRMAEQQAWVSRKLPPHGCVAA